MNPIKPANKSSSQTTWRVLGLLLALAGVVCFFLEGPFFVQTFGFIQRHLSLDHHISAMLTRYIHQVLIITGALLVTVGIPVVIWAAAFAEMGSRLVVLYSNLTGRRFSLVLLWSSSSTGLILVACWFLRGILGMDLLHAEGGPLETFTAISFIVSSLLLFGVAMFHRRQSTNHRKAVSVLLVGIAVALLLFGLEEISWGQRLFGWRTPDVLQQINDQGELNIHNLSTPLLLLLYRWSTLALVLLTVAGWGWLSRFKESALRFLIPHWATGGLLLLMLLFGTYWLQNELLEELGAVFALSYALIAIRASRRLSRKVKPILT